MKADTKAKTASFAIVVKNLDDGPNGPLMYGSADWWRVSWTDAKGTRYVQAQHDPTSDTFVTARYDSGSMFTNATADGQLTGSLNGSSNTIIMTGTFAELGFAPGFDAAGGVGEGAGADGPLGGRFAYDQGDANIADYVIGRGCVVQN
jgi:hypothetical protein